MLITLGVPPTDVTMIQLPTSPESEIGTIEILIRETQFLIMSKQSFPCKQYVADEVDFATCSQRFYASFLKDKVNCTIAGKRLFRGFYFSLNIYRFNFFVSYSNLH